MTKQPTHKRINRKSRQREPRQRRAQQAQARYNAMMQAFHAWMREHAYFMAGSEEYAKLLAAFRAGWHAHSKV